MTNNAHVDRVPACPGTLMWTDYYGNSRIHVITDDEHKELIAKNVEYLLYDGAQFVGYEHKAEVDIAPETE